MQNNLQFKIDEAAHRLIYLGDIETVKILMEMNGGSVWLTTLSKMLYNALTDNYEQLKRSLFWDYCPYFGYREKTLEFERLRIYRYSERVTKLLQTYREKNK